MKYLSKESAINTTKQLFSSTETDAVTLTEAAKAWGREDYSEKKNRRWLDNKMTHLKYHNLITPVYIRRNSRRILDKIQLTLEGKKAIGKIESQNDKVSVGTMTDDISFNEVMKLISKLRETNPEYQITFDIKLKGTQ